MKAEAHKHVWECLSGKKVICHPCNIVANIDDLLSRTESLAMKNSKIIVLAEQLRAGELKKGAADKAYAWVRQNNPGAINPINQQGALF